MQSPAREKLAKKLSQIKAGLHHAFATKSVPQPFSIEEVELLERIADAIVKRGMAAPAMVFFESLGPMNFLGSQALHFLTPIIEFAFDPKEVQQVACLLERRDTIARLITLIEAKSPR